jgi:hypothetical protein
MKAGGAASKVKRSTIVRFGLRTIVRERREQSILFENIHAVGSRKRGPAHELTRALGLIIEKAGQSCAMKRVQVLRLQVQYSAISLYSLRQILFGKVRVSVRDKIVHV